MSKNKTNKLQTGEFKYRPFYMSEKIYTRLKEMKVRGKYKSFNDLFKQLTEKKKIS